MNASASHAGPSRRTTVSLSPSSSPQRPRPPRPLKVVIIGPGSVGKTSLRQTYFTNRFQHNYKATIGADFEAKIIDHNGTRTLLTVWDTAGQERFRALGSAFYRGADAALVCFDASHEDEDVVRKGIEEWYDDFANHSGLSSEERERFCWVAVGCKADLRGEGAVPRRRVRGWLDKLMPRGEGSAPGHGDRPPADPTVVLAREGRHQVDDEELNIAAGGEGDDDEAAPQPFPSSSPPRASSPHRTPPTAIASSGSAMRTPPQSTRATLAPSTAHNSMSDNALTHSRNRLDSTRSFASTTTQLSVYHTPRNSTFWNGSAAATATTSASSATAMGSPVRHRGNGEARRERSLSTESGSTTKMGGVDDSEEEEEEDEGQTSAPHRRRALTPSSTSTVVKKREVDGAGRTDLLDAGAPTRSASRQTLRGDDTSHRGHQRRRRRPLSTPSVQSLALPNPPTTPLTGFSLFYTSALDGTNVRAVFSHVVSRCTRRWELEEETKAGADEGEGDEGVGVGVANGTARRKSSKVVGKRRSWWLGGGGASTTQGAVRDGEESGFAIETRRMVRLSDGKGDDSARLLGGCC